MADFDQIATTPEGYVARGFFSGKPSAVRKLCLFLGLDPRPIDAQRGRTATLQIGPHHKITRERFVEAHRYWESL